MKALDRKAIRKILMEEVLNASEMTQFSGSKSGKAVKKAGAKIMTAGKSIRDIAEDHQRSQTAISARLKHHKLIDLDISFPKYNNKKQFSVYI